MPEKEFVKARPLKQAKEKTEYRPRENKKNFVKKYQQKNATKQVKRQPIKYMLSTFKIYEKNHKLKTLIKKHPKFFSSQIRKPQEDLQENFNDCLWIGGRKQIIHRMTRPISSDSSEPAWDSSDEKQINLISKKIDENIIKKVNENMPKISKKPGQLEKHEEQFLKYYYLQKRHDNGELPQQKNNEKHEKENKEFQPKENLKDKEILQGKTSQWAEYDPKVNDLLDKGLMMKMDNDDDFQKVQFLDHDDDDDFSFESEKQSNSSQDDDDDMFTDEGPRKLVLKKTESEIKKEEKKYVVKINDHFFTQIAEKIGVNPQTCVWIISNKNDRYKTSTSYMNEYYYPYKMNTMMPYVSLNNSAFIQNQEINTEKGLQVLRKRSYSRSNQRDVNVQKKRYPNYHPKK